MSPRLTSRQRAFTLVELLVVIGIMSILIGLLLPSLAKARAHAKMVQCGAIIRQLGIAFNNYADNNKGWIQLRNVTTTGGPQSYSNLQVVTGGTPPIVADFTQGYLSKYLGRADVMRNCPLVNERDTNIVGANGAPYDPTPVSYGYSPYVVNMNNKATTVANPPGTTAAALVAQSTLAVQLSRVRYPVETFFFGDAAAMNGAYIKYLSFNQDWVDLPATQTRPDGTIYNNTFNGAQRLHGRHLGKASVMWFDGHVTTETPNYSSTYTAGSNTPALRKSFNMGDLMPPGTTYGDPSQNYYFWKDKSGQF